MKDGMLLGLAVGLIAGAMLFKHCDCCQDVFNKGEKAIKSELDSLSNNKKKSNSKA